MSTYEEWIPWETDSPEYEAFRKHSAVESLAFKFNMYSDTVSAPSGVLDTEKFGVIRKIQISELYELSGIQQIHLEWGSVAGTYLDSMCLGARKSASTESLAYQYKTSSMNLYGREHTKSLYTRENLNRFYVDKEDPGNLVQLVESLAGYLKGGPKYFADPLLHNMDARPGIIAHPAFRKYIDPTRTGVVGELPVKWSLGCAVSEKPTSDPDGNPLLYVGNANALHLGVRSGPESNLWIFDQEWADEQRRRFAAGEGGFLSDEDPEPLIRERLGTAHVKMRARRAFNVDPLYPFHCVEMVG